MRRLSHAAFRFSGTTGSGREGAWNLWFALGILLGGFIAARWLMPSHSVVAISDATRADLHGLGLHDLSGLVPSELIGWSALSEVLSWYRIQEMFRFQGIHMYAVIASALLVAWIGVQLIQRLHLRTLDGERISIPSKAMTPYGVRYWAGGTVFGLGWGLLGACPGPMFALIGAGAPAMSVALLGAVAGKWFYGAFQTRLPH